MTGQWQSGWATGDITFASEYRKGIGALFDTTLGAPAANVDITSIVATYAHLFVVVYGRSDTALGTTALFARFNNDSAGNYDYQTLQGQAAAATASEGFAQLQFGVGNLPANTAAANLFSACVMWIPHYAGSSNNKATIALSASKIGTASGNLTDNATGGFWRSNAAINRLTIFPGAGNFVAGTRVTLYGLGA